MCSHVPDKGEQMVNYGYYSNVSRGKRHKQNQDGLIPCILEADVSKKRCQKNWARLIRNIHPVEFPEGNLVRQGKRCRSPDLPEVQRADADHRGPEKNGSVALRLA